MTTIHTGTTTTTGFSVTSDTTGDLVIKTGGAGGTTAATFDGASQQATFAAPVSQPGAFMFRNKIINGNFDIWQRGASQTNSGYGSADRWENISVGSTKTASQQAFALGQTDVPNNPKYFMRHVVTSVAGAGNVVFARHKVENVETLSGKTVTLSFWAKADASKNIAISLSQYFGSGGSPSEHLTGIGSQLIALTTSWEKHTVTVDLPSVSGKTLGTNNNDFLGIYFWFDAGSDFNDRSANLGQQSGTFDIAQVQLEEGAAATPFEMRPYTIEQQLCYRYYQHSVMYRMRYSGHATNQVLAYAVPLKVAMRIAPSSTRTILNGGSVNSEVVAVDYIYSEIFAASAGQTIRATYNLDAEL